MDQVICPICGETFENRMKLGSHMWTKHKTKLKEYEAAHSSETPNTQINESSKPKAAEALIQPKQIKESKEILETPAVKVDKDFVVEKAEKNEFVKQKNEYHNPYRDLYPSEGEVLNEFLGR